MTVQMGLKRRSLSSCGMLNAEQGSMVFSPQPREKHWRLWDMEWNNKMGVLES